MFAILSIFGLSDLLQIKPLHHCLLFFLFLAYQIFYRSYVNRQHFRLRSFASLCYTVQQILVLLLVFHQTRNLSRNKFARARANQPISALHFFNSQQMFLFRVKLITQGEKRETSTKTCNETMSRDKLRIFVSRISPPLHETELVGRLVSRGGGGALPYMGYKGMCGPKGYGFSAVLVIDRVSMLANFGHFGHK